LRFARADSILLDLINLLKSQAARLKLLCVILLYAPSIDFLQKTSSAALLSSHAKFDEYSCLRTCLFPSFTDPKS
jgi:hypothetical protein